MSADWVRRNYGVDFKRGDRVTLHNHWPCTAAGGRCADRSRDKHGVIVSFPGQYVGVRFDGEKHTSRCHPTWRLSKESDS